MVDSIGFKDTQVWSRRERQPAQRRIARGRALEPSRLRRPHSHVETLIEDPKFYTQPFTYSRTWVAGKPEEELNEYACSENNVDRSHLGFGPGPIRPDGTRGFPTLAPLPPPLPTTSNK